jgi:hypothetical protein
MAFYKIHQSVVYLDVGIEAFKSIVVDIFRFNAIMV